MKWRAQIVGILMMGLAGPAFAAAEAAPKGKDGKDKGQAESGFAELPGSAVPGSEEILDAARERLVARTKQDLARRAALKEEAERQRKIRQGLKDAGVDLQYLPVPDAIRELERMTPAQAKGNAAQADGRSDRLYSAIEESKGELSGVGVERSSDRDVLIRILCNEKGPDLDGQTLDRLGMSADEARQLTGRICP